MSLGAGAHQCAAHSRPHEGSRWKQKDSLKEGDQRSRRGHSQPEVCFYWFRSRWAIGPIGSDPSLDGPIGSDLDGESS